MTFLVPLVLLLLWFLVFVMAVWFKRSERKRSLRRMRLVIPLVSVVSFMVPLVGFCRLWMSERSFVKYNPAAAHNSYNLLVGTRGDFVMMIVVCSCVLLWFAYEVKRFRQIGG